MKQREKTVAFGLRLSFHCHCCWLLVLGKLNPVNPRCAHDKDTSDKDICTTSFNHLQMVSVSLDFLAVEFFILILIHFQQQLLSQ